MGSTSATDARDNTSTTYTTYTSTNKGVRIYWLNGNKVADEYEDFYDGTWDEESNPTNESGSFRLLSAQVNYPFTGSNDNGTKDTVFSGRYLGASNSVRVGRPGSSNAGDGPLYSGNSTVPTHTRPFYALSEVFQVPILPGAPRGLRSGAGDGQVTLYWSPPGSSGRILRYEYWRRSPAERDADGNEVWHAIPDSAPGANAERFTVTGLTNGQLHIFMLRAVNAQGPGARANTTVTPVAGAPGAPGNLAAETVSDTEVRLSWTEPAAGAGVHITGYNIEKSTDGGVSWDGRSRTEAPGSTSATLGIGRNADAPLPHPHAVPAGRGGERPLRARHKRAVATGRGTHRGAGRLRPAEGGGVGRRRARGRGRRGGLHGVARPRRERDGAGVLPDVRHHGDGGRGLRGRAAAPWSLPRARRSRRSAVAILDDDDEDNGEFFRLALSLPAVGAGGRLEREAGGGTIRNSETPAATPEPEPVNTPATGRPTIAGTARVGATLDSVG